jgi:hypothetical protein
MKIESIKLEKLIPYARNFTGKKAIHESSGKTFDEMKP